MATTEVTNKRKLADEKRDDSAITRQPLPATLLFDTFAIAYPSKRYQSAWIGIAVHSAQSLFFGLILLALVL
jgi:hypothetical protein